MAKLISLFRDQVQQNPLGRRELPLSFDENLAMVMKLPELSLNALPPGVKGAELTAFVDKCTLLTSNELADAMKVSSQEVFELIAPNVPCVGCRRSVERLFHELVESGQDALYPVTLTQNGVLGLDPKIIGSFSMLFVLLKYYGSRLSTMVESITVKSRQTRRCPLHSLDAHRARPTGVQWRPLWDSMAQECREELTLVDADALLDTLEAYLQKHRFCPECRLKVLRAYSLLVGEVEPSDEKGYKPLLYLGLKCCPAEKHIHVQCNTDLISLLIARAEPELVGSSRRERHAKTMEVAQEEVVTCVGICLLERLQRVAQRLREEEQMADMLQFASLQAMRRSFELAVESKRGFSQLELLCEELSRDEAVQKQRKEAKKLRRKKRKTKKDTCADPLCLVDKAGGDDDNENEDDIEEAEGEVVTLPTSLPAPPPPPCQCSDSSKSKGKKNKNRVNNNNEESGGKLYSMNNGTASSRWDSSRSPSRESCSCSVSHANKKHQHSSMNATAVSTDQRATAQPIVAHCTVTQKCPHDSGYCSTNSSNLTTPEGSDVACTEGLCNHHSGSPVQCRPSPSPVLEGNDFADEECVCAEDCAEDGNSARNSCQSTTPCPIHFKLRDNCLSGRSLQQMLEEWHVNSEGDDEESYIPLEEVQAFRKQQQHFNEQRRQLRNDLRLKFDQLCGRFPSSSIGGASDFGQQSSSR